MSAQLVESRIQRPPELPVVDWSVGDLLRDAVRQAPDRIALIHHIRRGEIGAQWTYRQLLSECERIAAALLARFQPGDRIATWAAGKPELVQLFLGAGLAGMTLVTLNPACKRDELRYLLSQSASRGLFLDPQVRGADNLAVLDSLRAELPTLETVVRFDHWAEFLGSSPNKALQLPQVAPAAPALICFTSGTTGKPKGVVLKHRGIVNNARASAFRFEVATGSVWLNLLPMFHIGGTVTNTLGCLSNVGTQVLLPDFDADAMLDAIQRHGVTLFMAVPTMMLRLFQSPNFPTTDVSSVEVVCTGGTTVPPELVREIKRLMDASVQVMFGQTEAGGCMTLTRRRDDEDRVCNTVGTVLGGGELKIIRTGDGKIAAVEEIGEVCVRSAFVMAEYFRMPDKTAETLDADGWIHTGDLGRLRGDGYVQVTGRLKDMIIRGGENIYPREIEDRLVEHPTVAQAAVFGVPDPQWGEQVAAAIVSKPGQPFDAGALAAFLHERIARYKVPRFWLQLPELPVNTSGKIQKFLLQADYPGMLGSGRVESIK